MTKLCIVGAGGHGKVVADCAQRQGKWQTIFFVDDFISVGTVIGDWSVKGNFQYLAVQKKQKMQVVIAIGDNQKRAELYECYRKQQFTFATIVHPSAVVSSTAILGAGTVVFANAVVNPFVTCGVNCIINTAATLDHDCTIADSVHIAPQAAVAGNVSVGSQTWVGMNAAVKESIQIGAKVIVGMGSAVVKNVPDNITVLGIPARPVEA